jgi:hypothetical protein
MPSVEGEDDVLMNRNEINRVSKKFGPFIFILFSLAGLVYLSLLPHSLVNKRILEDALIPGSGNASVNLSIVKSFKSKNETSQVIQIKNSFRFKN